MVDKINKTLDELVAEDKKLSKYHGGRTKHRDGENDREDRDDRRYGGSKYTRERSYSGGGGGRSSIESC
jgi:hypothetical protein